MSTFKQNTEENPVIARQPRLTPERRRQMLAEMSAAYAVLRADPAAWHSYFNEIEDWDVTLMDGLEEE